MLVTEFVKVGSFVIWLKVIKNYGYSVISNSDNSLYSLYLFVLFFGVIFLIVLMLK